MPKLRTIQESRANLEGSLATISDRYTQGVTGASWQANAMSPQAEQNYRDGVTQAIADGTRISGIQRVSDAQWQNLTLTKGAPRLSQGIRASLDKYVTNFGPVLTAMNDASSRLPARSISARENVERRLLPIIAAAKASVGKSMT